VVPETKGWGEPDTGDDDGWETLSTHIDYPGFGEDYTPDRPPVFPLHIPPNRTYQAFRIKVLPNSEGQSDPLSKLKLMFGGLELYGQLSRSRGAAPITVSLNPSPHTQEQKEPEDSSSSLVSAVPAAASTVPRPLHAPWFQALLNSLQMATYFLRLKKFPHELKRSELTATIPSEYQTLFALAVDTPSTTPPLSLTRKHWTQLTDTMSEWSALNADAVPSPDQIIRDQASLKAVGRWLDREHSGSLTQAEQQNVLSAMKVLCKFNQQLLGMFAFVDLKRPVGYCKLTDSLRASLDLLFFTTKKSRFTSALSATQHNGSSPNVSIDPLRAARFAEENKTDDEATELIFGQIFQAFRNKKDEMYKIGFGSRAWHVNTKGMSSIDQGGPYRDTIEHMCRDLMSPLCPLFIKSPNSKANLVSNSLTTYIIIITMRFLIAPFFCF